MKVWLGLLLSLAAVTAAAKGKSSSKSRYPQAQTVSGPVEQVEDMINVVGREPKRSEKAKPVHKGSVYKDKAQFRLGDKAQLRLALSSESTLILNENTEALLPNIAWEDGGVKEILLKKGSLRYICKAKCERKIITPLYEGIPPVGDYLIEYDPKTPRIQITTISGEMAFRGLENETAVVLHAGEKASFKGQLENEEPVYDFLLKGRKVAKGQLSEVQKLSPEEMRALVKQEDDLVKAQKKAPKSQRLPSQICDKPWGELNQCAWICEHNKKGAQDCKVQDGAQCIRRRCNANGEWSDRAEIPASQSSCQKNPVVGPCNY
jgi:hypothetical protein